MRRDSRLYQCYLAEATHPSWIPLLSQEAESSAHGTNTATTQTPAKQNQINPPFFYSTNPLLFSAGSKGSSETEFLELNVYLNTWMTFLSLLQGQYSLSNGSTLFGWILSPEMNGQHQNLGHWQWNHDTEMPPSRDQCSNTHTHTYTNKKVLDVVRLK